MDERVYEKCLQAVEEINEDFVLWGEKKATVIKTVSLQKIVVIAIKVQGKLANKWYSDNAGEYPDEKHYAIVLDDDKYVPKAMRLLKRKLTVGR